MLVKLTPNLLTKMNWKKMNRQGKDNYFYPNCLIIFSVKRITGQICQLKKAKN